MRKKSIALVLALGLILSLAACGAEPAEPTPEPTPEAQALPVGSYAFTESAMGGAFTVEWELELREDGTYTIIEHNPFMGDLTYEGEYTVDSGVVTTLPFEGDPPQAEFFEPDKSCKWTLDGDSCMPVNYSGGDASSAEGDESGLADVAYASQSDSQVCDVHLPEGEGPFPVIVLVHGGGFLFGDQAMPIIQPVIEAGVNAGWAVVSVDYRKSGEAAFPAALADVKAAVRFVRANAEQYGLDPERIAIWGESAGAYLALMTALTPEVAELNGDVDDNLEYSSAVSALVDFYGPVEFYTMDAEYTALGREDTNFGTADSFESKFLGFPLGDDEAAAYKAYWGSYTDSLPDGFALKAWIQVGDADQNVPYTQSVNFAERLSGLLGEENVNFSIIEGAAHEDDLFYTADNISAVLDFLDGAVNA